MTLLQMQYFVCVANHMNISSAAKELYVSQPSISRQLSLMENELGFKLFQRHGQKLVELTIPGELLYKELKILLHNVDDVIDRAQSLKSQNPYRLRIGFMQNMDTSKFLHGELKQFITENPTVKVDLYARSFEDIMKMFIEDKLDVVFLLLFASEALAGIMPIASLKVFSAPVRLIIPKEYKESIESDRLGVYSSLPFVIVSNADNESLLSRTGLNEVVDAGIVPQKIIWAESVDTMITMVEEGLGIGVLGPSVRVYDNSRIFVHTLPDKEQQVGVNMCWRYNDQSLSLKSFISIMQRSHNLP